MLLLIPLLPFAGFLLNACFGRRLSKTVSGGIACATIAGCQRKVGAVTPGPMSPVVRSPSAVSTFQTNAACPCAGTHGW